MYDVRYKTMLINEHYFVAKLLYNLKDFRFVFVHTTKPNEGAFVETWAMDFSIDPVDDYDIELPEYSIDINDIKKVEDRNDIDFVYGYFNKNEKLVNNIKVAIEETNSKVYLLECPKNHDKEETTQEIIKMLEDKGYCVSCSYVNNMDVSPIQFNKKNFYVVATKGKSFDFSRIITKQKDKVDFKEIINLEDIKFNPKYVSSREDMKKKIENKVESSKQDGDYLFFDWHRGECREIKNKISKLDECVIDKQYNVKEIPIIYSKKKKDFYFISPANILFLHGTKEIEVNEDAVYDFDDKERQTNLALDFNRVWNVKYDDYQNTTFADRYKYAMRCPLLRVVHKIILVLIRESYIDCK